MGTYSIKPASPQEILEVPTDCASYLNALIPFKYAVVGRRILIGNGLYHKVNMTQAVLLKTDIRSVLLHNVSDIVTVDPLVLCIQVDD